VLASTPVSSVTVPVDAPEDFGEVQAELNELIESASGLDDHRHVFEVVRTCYRNGYRVSWNPLPLLMVLHPLADESPTVKDREAYREEIKQVYADMRRLRMANYANPNDGLGDEDA
jgi:hypothetical protein